MTKLCTVIIESSPNTKLSAKVFDFELPVLGEIHGHDLVRVVKEIDAAREFSAEEAYAALTSKYRPVSTEQGMVDPVRAAYRDTRDFAARTGLPLSGEAPVEAMSGIRTRETREAKAEPAKRGRPRKVEAA